MNKQLAKLTVKRSADWRGEVVKTLEDAGFVLVLETETSFDRYYIVAKSDIDEQEVLQTKELNEDMQELVQKVKVEFMNENVERDTEKETEIDRAYARGWNNCQCAILSNFSEVVIKDKNAFRIACELLNGSILYGYDADRIYTEMMEKDGFVGPESYEIFILNNLDRLSGKTNNEDNE